jgi:AcrR family transcriptional regulator
MSSDLGFTHPRSAQEGRLIAAVRTMLDDGGLRDPSMDEIARAVGINKATVYRHVASKDELLLLVLESYQREMHDLYAEVDEDTDPLTQFVELGERYMAFCAKYPAYLGCLHGLMTRTYDELAQLVSPGVLVRVFASVGEVNSRVARVLSQGKQQGVFTLTEDPDTAVQLLYAATAGVLQLVQFGVGVREQKSGFPDVFPLDQDVVRTMLMRAAAAVVGIREL